MKNEEIEQTKVHLIEVQEQLGKLTADYIPRRLKLEKERKQLQAKLQESEQEH